MDMKTTELRSETSIVHRKKAETESEIKRLEAQLKSPNLNVQHRVAISDELKQAKARRDSLEETHADNNSW